MCDPIKFADFDIGAFLQRNDKQTRQPQIFSCASALRLTHGYKKVAAVGYCYGGWAALRTASEGEQTLTHIPSKNLFADNDLLIEHLLVDCISIAHPSLVEESEIDAVAVPVQICAPEHDPEFSHALKAYANEVLPRNGIEYDYQFFPGLSHGFATRGDMSNQLQRKGLERAKHATVYWLQQHLHS